MRVAIVGSGYVGLVAGACFADLGHQVILVDNDQSKLAALNAGEVPIHEKFLPEYGLNFVNLVDRPTINVTELKKGEAQAGVRRALRIIRTYRPKVVCFIGKIAFNTFYNSRKCDWGWQTEIGGSRGYLMHFPIRGRAAIRVKELTEVKRADGES